jgi:hypothetical protein
MSSWFTNFFSSNPDLYLLRAVFENDTWVGVFKSWDEATKMLERLENDIEANGKLLGHSIKKTKIDEAHTDNIP